MASVKCISSIQGKMRTLSRAEQKVGKYIVENASSVLFFSVTELAEKAGVSDATVVRFSKTVGYKGYQDLKIHLSADLAQQGTPAPAITEFSRNDKPADLVQKVIQSEIQALNETLDTIDTDNLIKIAEVLLRGRRIVFFGTGGSILVSMDAMHKLLKIGIKSAVHMDEDLQRMESALLSRGDVAIGVSHSGANSHVLYCIRNAKKCGATTIAITTIGRTPLQQICDYVIATPTKELVFRSESVSARIAQLAVIDSIVAILSYMNYEKANSAILKTREATSAGKE